ncbi:RNA-directed DNA polymerase [Photobacterium damselae subsp. damselae]|uniref:retron Ec67 family RNA-directed DNA polymerase/endonuclease n=1 Tax=Photobacterium damselae TaxID=38293 RepID=UPI001593507B|nr:retron Ec67 family RNA-directed DNA polymerase/endonuclease [Photobacterium damselae]NVH49493.1 RNA-directed DNA polymerase [Photobacterium damselae subsp. damselae]NVO80763.1 RNA-directed DNA polymerase [Photobacterium damselae subsp. damselae]
MTTSLNSLKKCSSLNDFALLLGYQPKSLAYVLYKIEDKKKYTSFEIPKKSGGVRVIQKPNVKLKLLQKKLAVLLYECIEELKPEGEKLVDFNGGKNKLPIRKRAKKALSHGYEKGLSISTNAEQHINKKYVYNIDIESFFPSFNFGRVRGFFLKNKNFRLNPKVATVIAQIACFENCLPQGSPCSPVISNLIAKNLDYMLLSIARRNSCTYSRYVDDLTFSTNMREFPKSIAYQRILTLRKNPWILGHEVENAIKDAGFKINPKKSRMQMNHSRQEVTGLTVNKKVNISSGYYKMVRAMCHQFFMEGYFYKPQKEKKNISKSYFNKLIDIFKKERFEVINDESIERVKLDSPDILQGMLAHIYNVKSYRNRFARRGYRPTRHDGIFTKHKNPSPFPPLDRCDSYTDINHIVALDGIRNLYGRFLFFKYFYLLKKPLILCEGKTDITYLRCAIDQLATSYPYLRNDKGNNQVSFFNKTKINVEMLKLAEGTSGLTYLIDIYKRFSSQYKCEGQLHPVILLVDCDAAGNGVLNKAAAIRDSNRKAKKIEKQRHADYYFENLYIVKIPAKNKGKTDIENLFPDEVLNMELNKKKFNPKNKGADSDTEYGKAYFAEYVVRANKNKIDFSGFKPLLDNIQDIITTYDHNELD